MSFIAMFITLFHMPMMLWSYLKLHHACLEITFATLYPSLLCYSLVTFIALIRIHERWGCDSLGKPEFSMNLKI